MALMNGGKGFSPEDRRSERRRNFSSSSSSSLPRGEHGGREEGDSRLSADYVGEDEDQGTLFNRGRGGRLLEVFGSSSSSSKRGAEERGRAFESVGGGSAQTAAREGTGGGPGSFWLWARLKSFGGESPPLSSSSFSSSSQGTLPSSTALTTRAPPPPSSSSSLSGHVSHVLFPSLSSSSSSSAAGPLIAGSSSDERLLVSSSSPSVSRGARGVSMDRGEPFCNENPHTKVNGTNRLPSPCLSSPQVDSAPPASPSSMMPRPQVLGVSSFLGGAEEKEKEEEQEDDERDPEENPREEGEEEEEESSFSLDSSSSSLREGRKRRKRRGVLPRPFSRRHHHTYQPMTGEGIFADFSRPADGHAEEEQDGRPATLNLPHVPSLYTPSASASPPPFQTSSSSSSVQGRFSSLRPPSLSTSHRGQALHSTSLSPAVSSSSLRPHTIESSTLLSSSSSLPQRVVGRGRIDPLMHPVEETIEAPTSSAVSSSPPPPPLGLFGRHRLGGEGREEERDASSSSSFSLWPWRRRRPNFSFSRWFPLGDREASSSFDGAPSPPTDGHQGERGGVEEEEEERSSSSSSSSSPLPRPRQSSTTREGAYEMIDLEKGEGVASMEGGGGGGGERRIRGGMTTEEEEEMDRQHDADSSSSSSRYRTSMVAPLPSSIELHRLSPSFSPESLEHAQGRETSGMAQEEEEEQRVRRRSDAQIPTDLLPSSSSSPRGVEPESSRRGAPHGWPSSSSFSALQSLRDRLPRFHRERQIQSSANEGRTHFFSSLFFFSSGAREPGEGQEGREISPDSSQNDSAAAGGRGGERGQDRGRGGRLPPLNSSHRTQRRVGGGESAGSGRQQRGEEEEDQQGREEQNDVQGDDPSCHQLLFFSGLLCGFPLLWILGAMLWCITPKQHRRARRWGLLNVILVFFTLLYFLAHLRDVAKPLTQRAILFNNERQTSKTKVDAPRPLSSPGQLWRIKRKKKKKRRKEDEYQAPRLDAIGGSNDDMPAVISTNRLSWRFDADGGVEEEEGEAESSERGERDKGGKEEASGYDEWLSSSSSSSGFSSEGEEAGEQREEAGEALEVSTIPEKNLVVFVSRGPSFIVSGRVFFLVQFADSPASSSSFSFEEEEEEKKEYLSLGGQVTGEKEGDGQELKERVEGKTQRSHAKTSGVHTPQPRASEGVGKRNEEEEEDADDLSAAVFPRAISFRDFPFSDKNLPLSSPPFAGVGLRCIPLRASILSHAFPSSSSSFLADRLFSSSSSSSFLDSEKLLSLVQEGEEGGEIHSNLSRTPQTHRGTGEEAPPAGGGGGGEREREKEEEEGPFYRLGNRPLLGRQLPFRWMFLRVRRKRRENFEEVENGAEEEEEPEEEGGGPAEANKDTKKDKKVEKRARKRRARGRKKKGLAGRRFVSQVIDFSSSSSSSSPKYACAPVMVLVRKQREEGGGGVAEKSGQREEALSTEADRKKSPQQKPLHETLHIQQILVRALP